LAADGGDEFHVAPGLFQSFGTAFVILDNPLGESDAAGDDQSEVGDAFFQVGEGAARFFVVADAVDPGLNRLVTGFGGDFGRVLGRGWWRY